MGQRKPNHLSRSAQSSPHRGHREDEASEEAERLAKAQLNPRQFHITSEMMKQGNLQSTSALRYSDRKKLLAKYVSSKAKEERREASAQSLNAQRSANGFLLPDRRELVVEPTMTTMTTKTLGKKSDKTQSSPPRGGTGTGGGGISSPLRTPLRIATEEEIREEVAKFQAAREARLAQQRARVALYEQQTRDLLSAAANRELPQPTTNAKARIETGSEHESRTQDENREEEEEERKDTPWPSPTTPAPSTMDVENPCGSPLTPLASISPPQNLSLSTFPKPSPEPTTLCMWPYCWMCPSTSCRFLNRGGLHCVECLLERVLSPPRDQLLRSADELITNSVLTSLERLGLRTLADLAVWDGEWSELAAELTELNATQRRRVKRLWQSVLHRKN